MATRPANPNSRSLPKSKIYLGFLFRVIDFLKSIERTRTYSSLAWFSVSQTMTLSHPGICFLWNSRKSASSYHRDILPLNSRPRSTYQENECGHQSFQNAFLTQSAPIQIYLRLRPKEIFFGMDIRTLFSTWSVNSSISTSILSQPVMLLEFLSFWSLLSFWPFPASMGWSAIFSSWRKVHWSPLRQPFFEWKKRHGILLLRSLRLWFLCSFRSLPFTSIISSCWFDELVAIVGRFHTFL